MSYLVKEIFLSIQGEGVNSGRTAIFCRFSGCNLWSGKSEDRGKTICSFCDTEFSGTDGTGGGTFETPEELIKAISGQWKPRDDSRVFPLVVCTGGEPLLQLDSVLVSGLHKAGFAVAVETNGTIELPAEVDWVTVSPKSGTTLNLRKGDELKLVFPQKNLAPESFVDLDFKHFFLQPMSGPDREENTRLALDYCLSHPLWRLGIQLHTYLGIR